ncbi:MAG TPA: DNA-directed RNA polymerase subunit alpha C-terminal domain-containing protein [Anaerolineales bacterium]
MEVRTQFKQKEEEKASAQTSPARPLAELDLSKRAVEAFKKAGIENAGQFMERLAQGDDAVLAIEGVGAKALADTKKALRRLGYTLPEAEAEKEAAG